MKKELFIKITKASHKLTREMKKEFPTIDYRTQYGIFFKFLYQIEKNKKKKKKSNGSPIEIKVDNEIKVFNTIKECWNYLVEIGIKADIAKWFKNGVAKKYKDRIEYIKRVEKESTEEEPVSTGQPTEEEPISNETTVIVKERSFGIVFEISDGTKISVFKNLNQIRLYKDGSYSLIDYDYIINNNINIDINIIKELLLEYPPTPVEYPPVQEQELQQLEYNSSLIGKTFSNRKVVESWINSNNGKAYIKYIYNGNLDRVVPEQYFLHNYVV